MCHREISLLLLGTLLLAAPLVSIPLLALLGTASPMASTYLNASLWVSFIGALLLGVTLYAGALSRPVEPTDTP